MRVLKFGGSSVKNAENISKLIQILKSQYYGKSRFTVVVSALGGITDMLINMSRLAASSDQAYLDIFEDFKERHIDISKALLNGERLGLISKTLNENHETLKTLLHGIFLVKEVSEKTMDEVLSFGERNSAFIISHACTEHGIPAKYLDARTLIKTDASFGIAKVKHAITVENIQGYFNQNQDAISIATGFISSEDSGLTTTLGRGGSDYTAALFASALDATALDIWTDVDGVLTADPRKVNKAYTIPALSYNEAMELSHFGAKVIYPPTILPALNKGIPIYIKNTFNPDFDGTLVSAKPSDSIDSQVTGVTAVSNVVLIRLQGAGMIGSPGIAARLFGALAQKEINITLITQASSEYSICFAVNKEDAKEAEAAIKSTFEVEIARGIIQNILLEYNLSILAIVSEKMRNRPGVAGKLFSALGKEGVNVIAIAQGSSELNISFVIRTQDELKALNLIHDAFFLSQATNINIFSIGVGLIGSTLMKQLNEAKAEIKKTRRLDIRLIGLANSRKMLFQQDGINLNTWENELSNSDADSNPEAFVDEIIRLNLPNSVLIDNTANLDIPDLYPKLIENNISVVTPNKVAASSAFVNYLSLKNLARDKGVHFLYETNVGAGLPIIATIQNMIASGDKIHRIEAVLSGSISYIFNTLKPGESISEVVKKAKELGLTEPDPRDDLSGLDVARKITILARETGLAVEKEDVILQAILNKACLEAETVEDFFSALEEMNPVFDQHLMDAQKQNFKLRYLAKLINGKCSVSLEKVGADSPFFTLEETDNMIVIYSDRYNSRPLIIRGPGAGADVTAAGVFAEILLIGSSLINN